MLKYVYGIFAGLGVVGVISYFVLILLMVAGYVMNILDLIGMAAGGWDAQLNIVLFLLRIVGIFFAPLGGLLGWFA